jgi:hypothetical protein
MVEDHGLFSEDTASRRLSMSDFLPFGINDDIKSSESDMTSPHT